MTGPDPRHDPVELSALALGLLPPSRPPRPGST